MFKPSHKLEVGCIIDNMSSLIQIIYDPQCFKNNYLIVSCIKLPISSVEKETTCVILDGPFPLHVYNVSTSFTD